MLAPPPPTPTMPPDPYEYRPPAPGDGPRGTSFLLGLVRKLIDYGKQLAAALQQHPPATTLPVSRHTGPIDIGLILARITRGLFRAAALEARLLRRARQDENPTPPRPSSPRQPCAAQPAARRAADPRLARLPTSAEIAAQVRRRPIGAVFADICHDLGIVPTHALWRQLTLAVVTNGGRLTALLKGVVDHRTQWITDLFTIALPERPASWPPVAAGSSTGPP